MMLLLSVMVPENVPVPLARLVLPPSVVVAPLAPTVRLRLRVTPVAPMRRAVFIVPVVLASLIVTAVAAEPRALLLFTSSVPLRRVVVPA